MYSFTLALTSALVAVGGQRHAPAALLQGNTGTHRIGSWVGPRAALDGCRKSLLYRHSIPDHPAHSESLYRLRHYGLREAKWIGHILRMNCLLKHMLKER
jgi:hypothetical protein